VAPSAWLSCCVNAGSGAVRVAVGAGVPADVLVRAGVVAGFVVVGIVEVLAVWATAGAPAAETVFVCEPQPASKAAVLSRAAADSGGAVARIAWRRDRFIAAMVFVVRAAHPRAGSVRPHRVAPRAPARGGICELVSGGTTMADPTGQLPGGDAAPQGGRRSTTELARTGAMVVLAVLITLFAVLNLDEVKVDWIFGSGHAPLIIVIVISLLVGVVLTYFAERLIRKRR
jgi:uncharacterized integral membrane protein